MTRRDGTRWTGWLFMGGFAALALPGCPPDTCNTGSNMSAPRLAGGLESAGEAYRVRIVWDAGTGMGAGLPDAYFAAVSLGTSAGTPILRNDLIASVELTGPRELTVTFEEALDAAFLKQAGSVAFRLYFPDRREFIACQHPGSEDSYHLDVSLAFDAQGNLQGAEMAEGRRLGPI